MNYIDFQVKDTNYKLRLTTKNIVSLEKQLGCNPVAIFGNGDKVPTITVMVGILHSSLQALEHGITLDKAYELFDEWLEDGHVMTDFIAIIIDIYKASGIIKDTPEKN